MDIKINHKGNRITCDSQKQQGLVGLCTNKKDEEKIAIFSMSLIYAILSLLLKTKICEQLTIGWEGRERRFCVMTA